MYLRHLIRRTIGKMHLFKDKNEYKKQFQNFNIYVKTFRVQKTSFALYSYSACKTFFPIEIDTQNKQNSKAYSKGAPFKYPKWKFSIKWLIL